MFWVMDLQFPTGSEMQLGQEDSSQIITVRLGLRRGDGNPLSGREESKGDLGRLCAAVINRS